MRPWCRFLEVEKAARNNRSPGFSGSTICGRIPKTPNAFFQLRRHLDSSLRISLRMIFKIPTGSCSLGCPRSASICRHPPRAFHRRKPLPPWNPAISARCRSIPSGAPRAEKRTWPISNARRMINHILLCVRIFTSKTNAVTRFPGGTTARTSAMPARPGQDKRRAR